MKKLILLVLVVFACQYIYGQTGLLGLSFQMELKDAKAILNKAGFSQKGPAGDVAVFSGKAQGEISSVILIGVPNTGKLAGWVIEYKNTESEEADIGILSQIHSLHGSSHSLDRKRQEIIWELSPSRSLRLSFSDDEGVIALYCDSAFQELFSFLN